MQETSSHEALQALQVKSIPIRGSTTRDLNEQGAHHLASLLRLPIDLLVLLFPACIHQSFSFLQLSPHISLLPPHPKPALSKTLR